LVYASSPLSSWVYRAEGGSAVVFGCADPSLDGPLSSLVLRVRKVGDGARSAPYAAAAVSGTCGRVRLFRAPAEWLAALASVLARADAERPSARSRADALDADALELQEDAAALPWEVRIPMSVQWAVEVKPKAAAPGVGGAVPACRFCARAVVHALDESAQTLSAAESGAREGGAAATPGDEVTATVNAARLVSLYCPVELFSGVAARARAALEALSIRPRNNFRVWHGGGPVKTSLPDALLSALAAILCGLHSPLPQLRAVQDAGDAAVGGCDAGALELVAAAEAGDADADARLGAYLCGATAKDASVVVALAWEEEAEGVAGGHAARPVSDESPVLAPLRSVHALNVSGRRIFFSCAVVDWEAKPRDRVRKWAAAAERDGRVWRDGGARVHAAAGKSTCKVNDTSIFI
jgi:hypothetical protein